MTYPAESLYEEVAYVAYHFGWSRDEILDLEHLQGVLGDGPPRYERTGVTVLARGAKRSNHAAGNAPGSP